MADVHDLAAHRRAQEARRALTSAVVMTMPADAMPERPPVTVPGFSVSVVGPEGEALLYPCETGGDEMANCLMPALAERHLVVAALKEALAALGHPINAAPDETGSLTR